MSYKELKKRIVPREGYVGSESTHADDDESDKPEPSPPNPNGSPPANAATANASAHPSTMDDSAGFFTFLKAEVEKVNDFFLEKQEDFIIEHQHLTTRVQRLLIPGAASRADVNRLRQRLIDFHAQLVILENYSTVNYTGFRKILKKHDKKTGLNIRSVCLRNVTATPFFLSDIARRLLLSIERQIAQLEQIRKFRRPKSATNLPLPAALPTHPSPALDLITLAPLEKLQAASTSEGAVAVVHSEGGSHDVVTITAPLVDRAQVKIESNEQKPSAHPEPSTGVGMRSKLLRLYRDAVEFARLSLHSGGTTRPPQSLVDVVDALDADALGLTDEFMRKVKRPYDYCIAGDEDLSVGFFVLPPGTTLQLFNFDRPGAVLARLIQGSAHLRVYRDAKEDAQSDASRQLDQVRSADVVGPWPAVTACSTASFIEWTARDTCAIVYIQCPPVTEEELQRYTILVNEGVHSGQVTAERSRESTMSAVRVWF